MMTIEDKIDRATSYMTAVMMRQGRDWFSPTEIGREINGGHSSVGSPVCKEMVRRGMAERSNKGHYRLIVIAL